MYQINNEKFGHFLAEVRKEKQMTQKDLADKLFVSDKTVSKWERGLSVPDSEMLIHIAEILETPVSVLLGETQTETEIPLNDWNVISEKLEVINLQLAREKETKRKVLHGLFIVTCALLVVITAVLIAQDSSYLEWNFSDPEMAVVGTFFHAFEWLFVRMAPVAFLGAVIGIMLTRPRK